jgi:hypothetical protein
LRLSVPRSAIAAGGDAKTLHPPAGTSRLRPGGSRKSIRTVRSRQPCAILLRY